MTAGGKTAGTMILEGTTQGVMKPFVAKLYELGRGWGSD